MMKKFIFVPSNKWMNDIHFLKKHLQFGAGFIVLNTLLGALPLSYRDEKIYVYIARIPVIFGGFNIEGALHIKIIDWKVNISSITRPDTSILSVQDRNIKLQRNL